MGFASLNCPDPSSKWVSLHWLLRSGWKSRFFLAQLKKSREISGEDWVFSRTWRKRDGVNLVSWRVDLRSGAQYSVCLCKSIDETWVIS